MKPWHLLTPSFLLISCGGGGAPSFEHLAEDTFMVIHIESEALFGSELWEEMLDERDFEDMYEQMQEGFEEECGGELESVSSMTFSMAPEHDEPFMLIRSDDKFDLEELSQAGGAETEVASDDDGGDGLNSMIDYVVTQPGEYWLRVESFGSGSISGEVGGRAGPKIFREAVTGTERLGPFLMERGDAFSAATNCTGDPKITLSVIAEDAEVEGVTIYRTGGRETAMCIEEGVYAFQLSQGNAASLLEELADEDWELDEDMLATLDEAAWGAEIVGAVSFDAMPRDARNEIKGMLAFSGLAERDIEAIDDVSGLLFAFRLGSDSVEFSVKVVCEDADAAEDVRDLLEEGLEFMEDAPDLSRDMEKMLKDVEIEESGEFLELAFEIDSKDLSELIEQMK